MPTVSSNPEISRSPINSSYVFLLWYNIMLYSNRIQTLQLHANDPRLDDAPNAQERQ